jgi:hypothetical protein
MLPLRHLQNYCRGVEREAYKNRQDREPRRESQYQRQDAAALGMAIRGSHDLLRTKKAFEAGS